MNGTIKAFDERRGLGTVKGDDGIEYPFHSTRIADQSRKISPGTKVTFEVVAGQLGRWEAARIEKR